MANVGCEQIKYIDRWIFRCLNTLSDESDSFEKVKIKPPQDYVILFPFLSLSLISVTRIEICVIKRKGFQLLNGKRFCKILK